MWEVGVCGVLKNEKRFRCLSVLPTLPNWFLDLKMPYAKWLQLSKLICPLGFEFQIAKVGNTECLLQSFGNVLIILILWSCNYFFSDGGRPIRNSVNNLFCPVGGLRCHRREWYKNCLFCWRFKFAVSIYSYWVFLLLEIGTPCSCGLKHNKSIMRACRRFEFRFSWGPQTQFLLSHFSISSYLSFRDKTWRKVSCWLCAREIVEKCS